MLTKIASIAIFLSFREEEPIVFNFKVKVFFYVVFTYGLANDKVYGVVLPLVSVRPLRGYKFFPDFSKCRLGVFRGREYIC